VLKLTGLREDNPQGWLAAVGTLRVLSELGVASQLSWDQGLAVFQGVDRESLIQSLSHYVTGREQAVPFKWADNPNSIKDDQFQKILAADQDIDWLSVYLPQGVGGVKSVLDLTGGRLQFAKVIRQTIAEVQKGPVEAITEALFGPWENKADVASLGWDPGALKAAATMGGGDAPNLAPHQVVAAAQWLAAESLPITGLKPKAKAYQWVTWSVVLDLEGVRSVVLAESTNWGGLKYMSRVSRNGQIGYLEPARTLSDGKNPRGSRNMSKQSDGRISGAAWRSIPLIT
jgi:hypothetical protein